ncbi:hypothetical protein HAX54_032277, partial [Datura stramonium]|nr:hypothetical protein [Datura stramonium]
KEFCLNTGLIIYSWAEATVIAKTACSFLQDAQPFEVQSRSQRALQTRLGAANK